MIIQSDRLQFLNGCVAARKMEIENRPCGTGPVILSSANASSPGVNSQEIAWGQTAGSSFAWLLKQRFRFWIVSG